MKITKRVREEAALICAIVASTPWLGIVEMHVSGFGSIAAVQLAWVTFLAAPTRDYDYREIYAEAEAMLRTGWTP